ncbi:hypothetical protein P7K49_035348, partial [Saguinus oedipus]
WEEDGVVIAVCGKQKRPLMSPVNSQNPENIRDEQPPLPHPRAVSPAFQTILARVEKLDQDL